MILQNAPSVTIHHLSPTIPVQLEKVNGPLTEKSPVSQSKDEEIFPMVLKGINSFFFFFYNFFVSFHGIDANHNHFIYFFPLKNHMLIFLEYFSFL